MKNLELLFLDGLADMYDAEIRLTKALPKLAKTATQEELREAFENHLAETEGHVSRLERVFESFGKTPKSKKCKAIVGLLKEGDELISDNKDAMTINAALIYAAQKVEHYEMASYGGLREWATQLGKPEAAGLLQEILDQEKAADGKLTEVARHGANQSAKAGDFGEESGVDKGSRFRAPENRMGRTKIRA